jgi:hypothetical protein
MYGLPIPNPPKHPLLPSESQIEEWSVNSRGVRTASLELGQQVPGSMARLKFDWKIENKKKYFWDWFWLSHYISLLETTGSELYSHNLFTSDSILNTVPTYVVEEVSTVGKRWSL